MATDEPEYYRELRARLVAAGICLRCEGSGRRMTSASMDGRALERHERNPEKCPACKGTGLAREA